MKKPSLLILLIGLLLCVTGCSNNSSVEPIDQKALIGTWQTENDVEKATLILKEDNSFSFKGTGFGNEEHSEVTLTELGNYTIEGNQLILNIEDVKSSGLEYEDFQSENLGNLVFYMELSDEDTELNLTEESGSVAYNFKKVT